MKNILDFEGLQIKLASFDTVKSWSHGEITKPETINYRTLKPEKDGLFCERIFGPSKDWECYCGKYKRIRYRGIICDKCGVEVTLSRVRRERMGHIKLACPVSHVWYFKGAPSKLSLLFDISPRNLSSIIYFAQYVVLEVDEDKRQEVISRLEEDQAARIEQLKDETKDRIEKEKENLKELLQQAKSELKGEQLDLKVSELKLRSKQRIQNLKDTLDNEIDNANEVYKTVTDMVKKIEYKSILTEDEYLKLADYDAIDYIRVGMGAEAIVEMIQKIDIESLAAELKTQIKEVTGAKRVKATKRLRVVEGMKNADIKPEWMVMNILPVIPPDLRPMVQLSGGRFASSDLNDLYRRVINRNNRLKHLIDLGAPEIILRNEKRMLQESVDALIDSSQSRDSGTRRRRRELRSLSEMLKGKQGRFRQNLLGKRVDYSGRSVIVVGPELKLNQCGLPKDMALEMFRPYVLSELIKTGIAPNVKSAKQALVKRIPEVYDILEKIIHDHPVLLNRAPTLHKLGIQAFFPVLVEGDAIRIHPCVCAGYNADFDGDQMAVHVPLSKAAQKEAIDKMMPDSNLLKPADGSPITVPNKEMVMGCYYYTSIDAAIDPSPTIFANAMEAIQAHQNGLISLRQLIKVRHQPKDSQKQKIVETSVGRLMFNEVLPDTLGFINQAIDAATVKSIVRKTIKLNDQQTVVKLIDDLKDIGFRAATISGLSVSVSDNEMIDNKDELIKIANRKAEEVEENYRMGLITLEEKRRLTNEVWIKTTDEIAEKTWEQFKEDNAVKIIIDSGGTRASKDQVKQLAAMRGLVVDPLGKIVELPTKSNFREGLSIFEFVTSSRGSRKGLTDSALKTADAGYLTRRLVDVAHDVIIRMEDCGTQDHLVISASGKRAQYFSKRIVGRILAQDVIDPKTKKSLFQAGDMIEEEEVEEIISKGIESVAVYSPLNCAARYGLCAKCYGRDFSTKNLVTLGTPVGVVAAQSIGEPGTQLTMRVKHAGGIVGLDVTQGLPRVEELFEMRTPKSLAPMAENAGKIEVKELEDSYEVTITSTSKPIKTKTHTIPLTSILNIAEGDLVSPGTQLASGSLDVKEVLLVKGLLGAQEYLLEEVQSVYESQGIPINDRHFEIIIRRMSDKVKVDSSGDTDLLPGEIIEKSSFESTNESVLAEGGEPASAQVVILGISKASLQTESWLSAASFQETTNILTEAAMQGRKDFLLGLKENVIIGRLIPTSPERAVKPITSELI